MRILAIDTSGREGSLALCNGDASSFDVLEFVPLAGRTYAEQLLPQVAATLGQHALANADVDLFVVASGPGSFTGLRVGLSVVKALGEVLNKPIVAVTILEAIAVSALGLRGNGPRPARLITALDAQRNEVFAGEYEPQRDDVVKVAESVISLADLKTWLGARTRIPMIYTPDNNVAKNLLEFGVPVELVARPTADSIARLGLQRYLAGRTIAAEALDAEYIRRSDAEVMLSQKI